MTKTVLLLLLCTTILANLTRETESSSEYTAWKAKHNKNFEQSEDRYRMYLYHKRVAEVNAHNQDPKQTYKKAANQFAAYTEEELMEKYLGAINPHQDEETEVKVHNHHRQKTSHPIVTSGSKNWVTSLGVDTVKDQGQCGSCWAFATVGEVEYAIKIKNNSNVVLSTQQLVDCTYSYDGCEGGWFDDPYNFIMHKGLQTESTYPYTATYGSCSHTTGPYKIQSFKAIYSKHDCSGINDALLNTGPLGVAVYAYGAWFYYSTGILTCATISPGYAANHAVMAVGIDPNYYLIQNSWGKAWGENGYIRLSRTQNCNMCGNSVWNSQV